MGPWWVRDENNPFGPGCSYETIRELVTRGTIGLDTILRGPTTNQFWTLAKRAPGVAHLLGVCHLCQRSARSDEFLCSACGAGFSCESDRQHMGLGSVQMLPGQAPAAIIAAASDRLDRVRPSVQTGPVRTATIQPAEPPSPGPPALIPRSHRPRAHPWALAVLVAVVAGGIVWATLWATVLRERPGTGESAADATTTQLADAQDVSDSGRSALEIGQRARGPADHPVSEPDSPGPTGQEVAQLSETEADPSPGPADLAWLDRVYALMAEDSEGSLAEARRVLGEHTGADIAEGVGGIIQRRIELHRLRELP